jgi:hypothetical protein
MKRYKFQALVTLDPPATGAAVRPGTTRRMVVRGEHHETHGSQLFSALVSRTGDDSPRRDDDHVIMTVALSGAEPSEYFEVGDHFALWLGGDIGHGVVTRRLFV